jgi:hypothetical protein
VALTNVVLSGVPFQFTTAPLTKLLPLTVRVKLVPPAAVLVGKSELIVGTGLLIANVEAPEVPPPGVGLTTVMLAEPVLVMSLAGTAALIWVALT